MLSIITAQACCLANQADTLAIKGTACPILQIHTRSVSCSNKATTSKHKKNQVKHPSDVHLLKFVGKLCISQSAHLDPPSIWTSSHSPGTARVGPHPPGRWLTEGTDWANTVVGTSSSASLPSPDQVKHDEGKQKTGRTR